MWPLPQAVTISIILAYVFALTLRIVVVSKDNRDLLDGGGLWRYTAFVLTFWLPPLIYTGAFLLFIMATSLFRLFGVLAADGLLLLLAIFLRTRGYASLLLDKARRSGELQRYGDAVAALCHGRRPDTRALESWVSRAGYNEPLVQFLRGHGPDWVRSIKSDWAVDEVLKGYGAFVVGRPITASPLNIGDADKWSPEWREEVTAWVDGWRYAQTATKEVSCDCPNS